MEIIPYGKQKITDDDISEVVSCLKSDYLTQGPMVEKFEKSFSNYVDSKYAIAVSNGTAALHLSVLALGLQKGDKVITTPLTFAASANCIKYCGAEAIFVDIDPDTFLLDYNKVKKLIESSPKDTFKGIITVNFAGRVNDKERFKELVDKHNMWIVEDACHSPGGHFIDKSNNIQKSGNGRYSDTSIFSFHPVKHIATGEGGMITTNDYSLYKKILKLRTHGITKITSNFLNDKTLAGSSLNENEYPLWYMEMQDLGFNYRLCDINSALGFSQLKSAGIKLNKRIEIAKIYNDFFSSKDYIINHSKYVAGHAYHLYVLTVSNRKELYDFLRINKIFTQIHYFPCHLMPYYRNLGWKEGDCPNAEEYYKNCISIPMYPELSEIQINYILSKIDQFYLNENEKS